MRKVIVIGCSGSGKSTFARKLRDRTGLPLYYLDQIWHKPDRTNISREEFDSRLEELLAKDVWILDGNYSRTLERRLRVCDTVFLFDLPLEQCLSGVEARVGKPREDMPWIEEEFDPEFRRWIMDFRATHLPGMYDLLEKYGAGRSITVFRSREEADAFLVRLPAVDFLP